jgi:hypothetical protein
MQTSIPSLDDARAILDRAGVFTKLSEFDPRWVGSIPLNLHGPGADADICCTGGDLDRFETALIETFGRLPRARITQNVHADEPSVIAKLTIDDLDNEIFGRARPVEAHESYVHWLAEDRLLGLAEPRLRDDIRATKLTGLKTEPAFAKCLGLGGDPYVEMLKLASPRDDALRAIIEAAGYRALPQ